MLQWGGYNKAPIARTFRSPVGDVNGHWHDTTDNSRVPLTFHLFWFQPSQGTAYVGVSETILFLLK